MSEKSERLREHFLGELYNRTAMSEFGLQVIEALEAKKLPNDRIFTFHEVMNVVDRPVITQQIEISSDPMFSPDALIPAPQENPQQQAEIVCLLAMGFLCSSKDAILEPSAVFQDERGAYHQISLQKVFDVRAGVPFKHPVHGSIVPDAAERMDFGYQLIEPF